jgi:hypothetical protein
MNYNKDKKTGYFYCIPDFDLRFSFIIEENESKRSKSAVKMI